jgi:diguanylate cyclase (GGDEF)-like protein/PAS domain S-box-containing protein
MDYKDPTGEFSLHIDTDQGVQDSDGTFFRTVFHSAALGIAITDRTGRILEINPSLEAMSGYSGREARGLSLLDVAHPDDVDGLMRAQQAILDGTARSPDAEGRFVHKDGHPYWVHIVARAVRGPRNNVRYLVVMFEDVDRRKQAEDSLRRERDFSQAVLDTADALVVVLDREGGIVNFNRACERLTGYSFEEVRGRSVVELFVPEEDRPGVQETMRRLLACDLPSNHENRWSCRDGTQRLVAWANTVLLDRDGRVEFLIATGTDVTARRLWEEELRAQSLSDELTGLHNRRGFRTLAQRELQRASRRQSSVALFYADLDQMKRINDTHGHTTGDAALMAAARLLRANFRDTDVVARVGGDEFAALTVDASEAALQSIRTRLQRRVEAFNREAARPWTLSLSLGVAVLRGGEAVALDDLMAEADRNMYLDKQRLG